MLECEDIGLEDNPEYAARDFEGVTNDNDQSTRGLFKTTGTIRGFPGGA